MHGAVLKKGQRRKIPREETNSQGIRRSLRRGTRSGTAVRIRIVDPARKEPELAAAEAPVRRAGETPIGPRSPLAPSAVNPQVVDVLEAFGVSQENDSHRERIETKLPLSEDNAGTAN